MPPACRPVIIKLFLRFFFYDRPDEPGGVFLHFTRRTTNRRASGAACFRRLDVFNRNGNNNKSAVRDDKFYSKSLRAECNG